jgi:hypothetical protein
VRAATGAEAGPRPTAAATLAAPVTARAYALDCQSEQARAALEAADALMNRLSESERWDRWLTYGEQKRQVNLSHAATLHIDAAACGAHTSVHLRSGET